MNNAASRLLTLLKKSNGNTLNNNPSQEVIAMEAGILLFDLKRYLDVSEASGIDLTFYRDKLPDISRAFFTLGGGGTVGTSNFSEVEFALQALSAHMGKDLTETSEEDAKSISEIAAELITMVSDDSTLPEVLRRYCFEVVNSVQADIARYNNLGAFDLQQSIDRLIAATNYVAAAYSGNPSMVDRAKGLWSKLMNVNKVGKDILSLQETASEFVAALPFTPGA